MTANSVSLTLEAAPWLEINDGVMGGLSISQVRNEEGRLIFAGELSLENNGGFASARRAIEPLPCEVQRVRLEVRGDGRTYQFRIRQDSRFDGIAWSLPFPSGADWRTVELPLEHFTAVFRGRPALNAGSVEAARVQQIGLMLADKRPGVFRLEVRAIEFLGPEPCP